MTAGSLVQVRVNSLALSKAIAAATAVASKTTGLVIRKTGTDILRDFQREAPVKLGRFRAGWSIYLIHSGHGLTEGPNGVAVAEGRALGAFVDNTDNLTHPTLSATNGVSYGPELEGGKSPQAAAGFHAAILARHAAAFLR